MLIVLTWSARLTNQVGNSRCPGIMHRGAKMETDKLVLYDHDAHLGFDIMI